MIDPSKILATKVTPIGVRVLIKLPDGKKKWIWRDTVKTIENDNWNEFISR